MKVYDLVFLQNGTLEMQFFKPEGWRVVYHLFDTLEQAEAFAALWPYRKHVIHHREWHPSFVDSPAVHDHRRK